MNDQSFSQSSEHVKPAQYYCPVIFDPPPQEAPQAQSSQANSHPKLFAKFMAKEEESSPCYVSTTPSCRPKEPQPALPFFPPPQPPKQFEARNQNGVIPWTSTVCPPSPQPPEEETKRKITPYAVMEDFISRVPIYRLHQKLYLFDGKAFVPYPLEDVKTQVMSVCRPAVEAVGTPMLLRQVCELLQTESCINIEVEPSQKFLVFDNGLLDLDTRQLLPYTSRVFTIARIKADYLPNLAGRHPVFTQFLSAATNCDAILQQRLLQIMGYALTPDTQGKVLFVFQGKKNSGKSLLCEFLARCVPSSAVTYLNPSDLGQRFGASDLPGKLLCFGRDLPATPWDGRAIGELKKFTGGDPATTDVKYGSRIKFRNTATFIFCTNNAITLTYRDTALLDRIIVAPFNVSVPRERHNHRLLDQLLAEKEAIIASSLNAYFHLRAANYNFAGTFPLNDVLDGDVDYLSPDMDHAIVNFFYIHCRLEADALTFTSDLHSAFCVDHPNALSLSTFSSKLGSFLSANFPGQVVNIRTRKPGAVNPTSALRGLRLI